MARMTYHVRAWTSVPVDERRQCVECGRLFDMADETDSAEWYAGHDCESDD